MKTCFALLMVAFLCGCGKVEKKPLSQKLLDTSIAHIKTVGPDEDTVQFIAVMRFHAWERREEVVNAVLPYLLDKNPDKVAGALGVLYRFRVYRPVNDIGSSRGTAWEHKYKPALFWAKLDKNVYADFEYFHAVGNDKVFQNLALYLGGSPSRQSKQELIRIAKETRAKDQALICLAWHRDPGDMKVLLPFMLENSQVARILPYHFRNSYGKAAIPYLKKAVVEAKSEKTKQKAEKELRKLENQSSNFL